MSVGSSADFTAAYDHQQAGGWSAIAANGPPTCCSTTSAAFSAAPPESCHLRGDALAVSPPPVGPLNPARSEFLIEEGREHGQRLERP